MCESLTQQLLHSLDKAMAEQAKRAVVVGPKFSPKKKVKKPVEWKNPDDKLWIVGDIYSQRADLVFEGMDEAVLHVFGFSQQSRPNALCKFEERMEAFLKQGFMADYGTSIQELVLELE